MTKRVDVNAVVFRPDLYPRLEPMLDAIARYADAIDDLPPIEVNQHHTLIDGYHRWQAHVRTGREHIRVTITETTGDLDVFFLSAYRNALHGVAMSKATKKTFAERAYKMAEDRGEQFHVRLASSLAIGKRTAYDYTKRLREHEERQRDETIHTLREEGKTQVEIAEQVDVPQQTVSRVLAKENTQTCKSASLGKTDPVAVAKAQVAQHQAEADTLADDPIPMPTGTYDILYADPPWQYEAALGAVRHVARRYPTMDTDAICALPVADLCADDACLFLWTTAPKLAEGMRVMDAWGFTYITNVVWDKVKKGMGLWVRVRHEHLLIGRRGNFPAPKDRSLLSDSIWTAERGGHSEKPPEIAEWITRLFPNTTRIELFSRSAIDGFDAWGNETKGATDERF